jgi:hypothetical protein
MDSFITSYGIPFEDFSKIINETGALIAGSSALALYLQQEGIDPGYKPNDIDIWIAYEEPCTCQSCQKGNKNPELTFTQLSSFLEEFGFKDCKKFSKDLLELDSKQYLYSESLSGIKTVTAFKNADGQEIQIIQARTSNLLDYIKYQFDLSCCVTWWDSKENTFKTHNPIKTKAKMMYNMKDKVHSELSDKELPRCEKYKSRGFTFVDPPCPFNKTPDPRSFTDSGVWTKKSKKNAELDKPVKAFDILTFDKTPIKEFLSESEWNIVIKSGDVFYAFNRKVLDNIVSQTRKVYNAEGVRNGVVTYKLPFGYLISDESMLMLLKSDYSIYEPVVDIPVKTRAKVPETLSLYKLKCYTVAGWENSTVDLITSTSAPAVAPKPPTIVRAQASSIVATADPFIQIVGRLPLRRVRDMLPPGAPYNPDLGLD